MATAAAIHGPGRPSPALADWRGYLAGQQYPTTPAGTTLLPPTGIVVRIVEVQARAAVGAGITRATRPVARESTKFHFASIVTGEPFVVACWRKQRYQRPRRPRRYQHDLRTDTLDSSAVRAGQVA